MKGTLLPLKWLGPRTNGALGEVSLRHTGETREVVMTGCAEVGGTEAEEDSYRAAITALVLEEVSPMLRAHLQGEGGRRKRSAGGVVLVGLVGLASATQLSRNIHTSFQYPSRLTTHLHSPIITHTSHLSLTHNTPPPLYPTSLPITPRTVNRSAALLRLLTSISRHLLRKSRMSSDNFSGCCMSGVPLVAIRYKAYSGGGGGGMTSHPQT